MAKLSPTLSLCFLLLGSCLALQSHQPQRNECQFDRLESLQPDNVIRSEAGRIETWNPNHNQFRCAGVALSRCTLEHNALRLPSYSNAPQLFFIRRGNGQFGIVFPGCAETFEEPQESESQSERSRTQDRHQKIRHFREGDVIAVPAGTAFWIYNNGETTVEAVSIIYTASRHNKLDKFPRRFYLAGNQQQEFLQYQEGQQQQGGQGQGQSQSQSQTQQQQARRQEQQQQGGQGRKQGRQQEHEQEQEQEQQQQQQQQSNANNIFNGFGVDFLAQAFNVDREVARSLQGHKQQSQGSIIRVRGDLSIISPPVRTRQQEDEDEEPRRRGCRTQSDNALEETICTMRLRQNIGKSTSPDIYNPQAGSLRTVNSLDLPVLKWLGLSAEFGSLHRDALFVPHYNLNANSIIYALQGRARVQIVDCSGKRVFDGELEEGQALTVLQNYAVAARSLSEHFLYVTFKTNDNAMMATLAGRTSVIRAWPVEVVAQSYQIKTEQARQLKDNNLFSFLVPPQQSRAEMRAVA